MGTENENNEAVEVEVDEAEMMEALDEGIAEVSPETEDDDDDTTADDDTGTDESGDDSDDSSDSDETDDDAAGDGDDSDDTSGDDDSDDSSDTDADDESGDDESEGDGETKDSDDDDADSNAAAADAKEPDHINDPIPEGTKEQTAARITGLIDIAKEQTRLADQGTQVIDAITGSGSTPEQFSNALGFLQVYNSKDPTSRAKALEIARGVVHELSVELGQGSPDLLTQHADLQAEVEEGTLTEKRAIEIATNRARNKLQESRTEQTQTQEDQTRETNRLITVGKDQLTAFENTVKMDPAYDALYATFRGILSTTLRTVHPDQWGETAKTVYANLKAGYTPAAVTPKPKPKKQPLRAKQGAGGSGAQEQEATSGIEALDAALDSM